MKFCATLFALAAVILSAEAISVGERWHEAPYMVRILYGPPANQAAGGAIISHRHVLTTAFVMAQQFANIQIFIGSTTRILQTPLAIQSRAPHPSYQQNPRTNDIGIFRLMNDIVFTRLVQPIQLAGRFLPFDGEQGTALGFGGFPGQANIGDLQAAFVRIVPVARCSVRYPQHSPIQQFCGEDARLRSDICSDDRGGPLVTLDRGVEVLTGIASDPFCLVNNPSDTSLYTRVSAFRDWIDSTVALP